MSSEFDLLERLDSTSGLNAKKELMKAGLGLPRFVELMDASLNFFRKFYIGQLDMPSPSSVERDNHGDFMHLLSMLESRQVTGDAARGAVEGFFRTCTASQQKWYGRVLLKKIDIGVGADLAIDVGYPIPVFDVMLAKDGDKTKNVEKLIKAGMYVSPKLDGYRCIAVFDGTSVILYSRNGSVYENFPAIRQELEERLKGLNRPIVLDGEIMSDNFQAMQKSAFASKRGTTVGDVKYHIFGAIAYDEWTSDKFLMDTTKRLQLLESVFGGVLAGSEKLVQVSQTLVYSKADIDSLKTQYIAQGYEGLMALPASSTYYRGRKSNQLLKFKIMHTMDCTVTGCYEGEGKHKGRLGGLNVLQENGVECDLGSGFDDSERESIWGDQQSVLGRICEVKYQDLTEDKVMRFPVFVRWRDSGSGTGKR